MSNTISTTTNTACPDWCVRDDEDRRPPTHPDDRGVWHASGNLTMFELADHGRLRAYLDGFRHDLHPEADWEDSVVVEIDRHIKFVLKAAEARQLSRALAEGAQMLEGSEAK